MAGSGGSPTVARAYVTIIPTTKDAQKNISKSLVPQMESAADEAGEAGGESLIGRLGSAVKSGAAKVASAAKVAAGAGVAALGAMTVAATQNFGQWEQLSGGIEKIFDQMDTSEIFRDADQAYKNLGMSANQYLESMVSVGATFASTLGDKRGYEVAKQGMQAIADYASGTGNDVDLLTEKYKLITRASSQYQGIADQFSGILPSTSADFLKQAQAAGLLSTSYTKLTDVPLAEYQQAVTEMLTRGVDAMGLLGNTAAEAEGTLEGSTAMMKASWDNLLTAFGRGDEEAIKPALESMLSSVEAWGQNIIPRVGTIMMAIIKEVPSAIALIVQNLPGWLSEIGAAIQQNIPGLLTSVAQTLGIDLNSIMENELVQALINLGKKLNATFLTVFGDVDLSGTISELFSSLGDFAAWLGDVAADASHHLADMLNSVDMRDLLAGFSQLRSIGETLLGILQSIGTAVMSVLGDIVWPLVQNLWGLISSTIMPGLIGLFDALRPAFETVLGFFASAYDWISQLVTAISEFLKPVIDEIFAFLEPVLAGIIDAITDIVGQISASLSEIWEQVEPFVSDIVEVVSGIFSAIGQFLTDHKTEIEAVLKFIGTAVGDAMRIIGGVISGAIGIITSIIQGIIGIVQNIFGVIYGVITGDTSLIVDSFWGMVNSLVGVFSGVFDIITTPFKDAFNAIRRWWNNTVGGFSFTVPSWIPGVGGKSFKIPKLATGGDITTAGTVMVGEAGPELLSLPRGARVTPLSDATTQSGNTYSVTVGDVDLSDDDQVRRVTREYLEFLARLAAPTSMVTA